MLIQQQKGKATVVSFRCNGCYQTSEKRTVALGDTVHSWFDTGRIGWTRQQTRGESPKMLHFCAACSADIADGIEPGRRQKPY